MTKKSIFVILILLTGILLWLTIDFAVKDSVVVKDIQVNHTLYENLSITKRLALRQVICKTLAKDNQALEELIRFDCGGAAGCYELGFIVTQLIYRLGESQFISMTQQFDKNELGSLQSLITVGLEYGDQNKDGKTDDKKFDKESPTLYKSCTNRQLRQTK
jgi:hypothetical protein